MADQVVLKGSKRRKGDIVLLPPSDVGPFAGMLLIAGIAVGIVGLVDVALLWIPPRLGDADWEFGIIAQSVEAFPLFILGLSLSAAGIRGRGGNRNWSRTMAVVIWSVSVLLLLWMGLFTLNIGQALQLVRAEAVPGLKRIIGKTILSAVIYMAALGFMGLLLWRSTSRRVAEVQSGRSSGAEDAVG